MDGDWTTSPSARRVQQHAMDSRPAWLWSHDGQAVLWYNAAAELFGAKIKKHGLKRAEPAVPIKGQIARNIRLGSPGRTSLARIQFLAGDKPVSATCATTPLHWENGELALLVVGVDPIDPAILEAARAPLALVPTEATDPEPAPIAAEPIPIEPVLLDESASEAAEPNDASPAGQEVTQPEPETGSLEPTAPVEIAAKDEPEPLPVVEQADTVPEPSQVVVEPSGEQIAVSAEEPEQPSAHQAVDTSAPEPEETHYQRELDNWRESEGELDSSESAQQIELSAPVAETSALDEAGENAAETTESDLPPSRLSRLVDQLASDEALYTPLTEADDSFESATAIVDVPQVNLEQGTDFAGTEGQAIEDAEADLPALEALDGRDESAGEAASEIPDAPTELASEPATEATPDAEDVERVSRYNFDELSRILNDRVGEPAPTARALSEPQRGGSLISLGGETLVLNRLPLGILVFRDQQVLFANRAITEMVGYQSVEALREAGLAAVFPAAGPDEQEAGPVNHLVQRDGTLVPVTARLQSISWQGRPALMLSASATEVRTGHEAAVRAFAQTAADLRGDGFVEATRSGVLSALSPRATALLGAKGPLEGKSLTSIIAPREVPALQEFLERPARFAESERPFLRLHAQNGNSEIVLFAQGQAGVVTSYFGFVRGRETLPARVSVPVDTDPALLARISRGVRRPLNTILGFAELLRTQAFSGQVDKPFEGYAQDIANAGQDIVALIDELDHYAQLREGRYLPQRSSINLTTLLESCVLRIRQQANSARVILRNAISERLPAITADQPSLEQAVLNLLASAIVQSPTGGAVVISAKVEDDGSIAIHVRDSSNNAVDMAERFVVFRDGVSRDGQVLTPVRSSVGLALTRSLLAVNSFSLSVDPAGERGLLFTLIIPADLVEGQTSTDVAE
jgi:signal transduction histidine kinase